MEGKMTSRNLNRRAVVGGVATLPALAAPAAASFDNTLSRIADHCSCVLKLGEILNEGAELEESLPEDRRRAYSIHNRGTDIGVNDDPRWTANQAAYWTAQDRLDELAWSFVDRPPTTIAGASALLAYANEREEEGYEWPDCRHSFSPDGRYLGAVLEDWRLSMNNSLLGLLMQNAVRS
jgi:hypothetical protein